MTDFLPSHQLAARGIVGRLGTAGRIDLPVLLALYGAALAAA